MTERFWDDIDPSLLQELSQTERAIENYANQALEFSTINVSIQDCQHPLMSLPKDVIEIFKDMTHPANTISGVDLQLKYDPELSRFTTTNATLKFDNNYAINFYKVKSKLFKDDTPAYIANFLDPHGKIAKQIGETKIISTQDFEEVLEEVGLGIPNAPQEASWNEIKAILQFSGRWSASTSHSTPIDLMRSLRVNDVIEGSSINVAENSLHSDDGVQRRQITFSVDEAKEIARPPSQSWTIVASAKSRDETPCIQRMMIIPLSFETPTLDIPEFGMRVVIDGPDERFEDTQNAKHLPITETYLQAAREILKLAMQ